MWTQKRKGSPLKGACKICFFFTHPYGEIGELVGHYAWERPKTAAFALLSQCSLNGDVIVAINSAAIPLDTLTTVGLRSAANEKPRCNLYAAAWIRRQLNCVGVRACGHPPC